MSFTTMFIDAQKANIRKASMTILVETNEGNEETVLTDLQLKGLFDTQLIKPNNEVITFGEITESCCGMIEVNAGCGVIYVNFRYVGDFINHIFISKYSDVRNYYRGDDLLDVQPLTAREVDRIFLVKGKHGLCKPLNGR